jgi:DHA1 family bicyclomycin/chloramphenicol resistance-like MFS transporter
MSLPPPPASRREIPAATAAIIPMAAALFAVLPLSTDVYLTAMVDLAREFGVAVAGAQRTMLAFTLGFGLTHLVIGELADRFGRRPTAIVGIGLYCAASILAATAPSLDVLVAARFLQGAAAASGPILSRTLIRDAVAPDHAGSALAKMVAYGSIAPLTAPLIGTFAASRGGWRAAIGLLAVYGALLALTLWRRLPETRPREIRHGARIPIRRALARLLRHRGFLTGAAALACGYGILLTWLSTSAFLLIGALGMSKLEASAIYVLGSAGLLAGSLAGMRLARSFSPIAILRAASLLLLLGAAAPTLALEEGYRHWAIILVCVLPFYVGWGVAQPMAIAIAMRPFADMAGQASAWLGLAQQIGGIALSLLAARYGGGMATPLVMGVGALGFAACAFAPQGARGRT